MSQPDISRVFSDLSVRPPLAASGGLVVRAAATGKTVMTLAEDTAATLAEKITHAQRAQAAWSRLKRTEREHAIEAVAGAIKTRREALAACIHADSGKTIKECFVEVDGSADVLVKTIKDASLPELGGMLRVKERPPVGLVGLITSFNFPMVVAFWSLAPAWLAGNAVLWKPSEKTPLVALAVKALFDQTLPRHAGLLEVLIGGRDIGQALVAHESVGLIAATGSVAMGQAIGKTLAAKQGNVAPPILELGGNNGVVISDKMSPAHLEWSVGAILGSFLGTTGQRCTNTRRVFIHRSLYSQSAALFESKIRAFMDGASDDPDNAYGYSALIDADAFGRFESAKQAAAAEGGKIVLGARLLKPDYPEAYYVEPALALMPTQTEVMHTETFAPLLFLAPYDTFDEAISLVNAPENAGLVAGIYTQNQAEADRFAAACEAGHCLINSAKGTGTPAHGMGFGGNKHSGCGEILNAADPLAAFTREGRFTRIAQNKDVAMDH